MEIIEISAVKSDFISTQVAQMVWAMGMGINKMRAGSIPAGGGLNLYNRSVHILFLPIGVRLWFYDYLAKRCSFDAIIIRCSF